MIALHLTNKMCQVKMYMFTTRYVCQVKIYKYTM